MSPLCPLPASRLLRSMSAAVPADLLPGSPHSDWRSRAVSAHVLGGDRPRTGVTSRLMEWPAPPPGGNKPTGNRRKGNEGKPAKIAVIGSDLGENSCSLAALDGNGTVVKRRRHAARQHRRVREGPARLYHRHGGLLRRAPGLFSQRGGGVPRLCPITIDWSSPS